MGVQEFIEIVSKVAVKLREEGSPIFPSVRIAQCAHETGAKFNGWNNLVGFKATGSPNPWWDGSYVVKGTWEVINGERRDMPDAFRAYPDIEHCLRDHERLMQADRYKQVRDARTPEDQAVALYRCGYATDPEYHKKLILNWILPLNLKTFDTPRGAGKVDTLSKDETQFVLDVLSAYWFDMAGAPDIQAETHRIAKKIRTGAGMEEPNE